MLSIGKLVAGQERYYEQQVARGRDDYYAGRGEAEGRWVGTGAAALGLEGEADGEAFGALIAGRDPSSGEVLRAGSGRDRVCALDLTFSAPKSVSVLFAIGDPETSRALVHAHEEAVDAAVGLSRAGGVPRPAWPWRPCRAGGGGVRGGGVPASDEPRGAAATAYARRCGELGPWQRRTLVGPARLSDLSARQGGRLAVSGAPARGRAGAAFVGAVGRCAQRDGRARGRAARGAGALLASAGGDPGMAGGRGSLGEAVGGEGRAGHARAQGRAGGAGAVVRTGAGRSGRARPRARRAHGVDSRSKPVPVATGRPRPRGRVPGRAGGADRPAQQLRGAARGRRAGRRSSPRCISRGGPARGGRFLARNDVVAIARGSGERRYTTASLLACERRLVVDAMRGEAPVRESCLHRSSTVPSRRCPHR